MNNNLNNHIYYNAYQPYMLLDFDFSFKNDVLHDDLSISVLEVLRRINLSKFIDFHHIDSRSYDPVMMLSVILLAFSEHGYTSLRNLEKLCRYDLRYRSITNGLTPSYKSFQRFINHNLKLSIQDIAKEIYLYIQDKQALEKWLQVKQYKRKGRGKHEIAKLCDELKKKAVKLWEYAIHKDILGNRNSFSKTDPDATFMHMKYDYYNHTNVFKPGYNVQVGVNNGYIAFTYISSDTNDMKTLQPFCEGYKKLYHKYPHTKVTDAGYGSYDNYCYCASKNIQGVMKYSGYEKKKEKINDKNRYRLIHMKRREDGTLMPSRTSI